MTIQKLRANPWSGFAVALLASFVILVDITIVNVALPSMLATLHATTGEIEAVVIAYQLAYGVALVTGGRLGDIHGRRRMFVIGFAGFAIASALSGTAVSAGMLVGSRVLQGISAAVMYPQVLSIIQTSFKAEDRSRAFALEGVAIGIAVGLGPTLGGLLIQANILDLSWRTIFLVNIPVAAIAIPAALLLMRESRSPEREQLDLLGVAWLSVALIALFFPLTAGRDLHWPAWTFALLASSAPLLLCFVFFERWRERRGEGTLLELSLLGNRPFIAGLLATLTFYSVLPSFSFALSVFFQQAIQLSPLDTGLVFIPFAVGLLTSTYPSSRFADAAGKWAPIAGCGVLVVGIGAMILAIRVTAPSVNPLALAPGLFVFGAGARTVITPLLTLVLAATRAKEVGTASGVLTTVQRIGGALGLGIIGLVFFGLWDGGPAVALEWALTGTLTAAVATAGLLTLLPAGRPEELARQRKKAA